MLLPPESIDSFKELYRQLYGETLSHDRAVKKANDLLNLYKTVYQKTDMRDRKDDETTQRKII